MCYDVSNLGDERLKDTPVRTYPGAPVNEHRTLLSMITLSFALATAELSDTAGVSQDPQSLLQSSKGGKKM